MSKSPNIVRDTVIVCDIHNNGSSQIPLEAAFASFTITFALQGAYGGTIQVKARLHHDGTGSEDTDYQDFDFVGNNFRDSAHFVLELDKPGTWRIGGAVFYYWEDQETFKAIQNPITVTVTQGGLDIESDLEEDEPPPKRRRWFF